jgi:hypothetical protein
VGVHGFTRQASLPVRDAQTERGRQDGVARIVQATRQRRHRGETARLQEAVQQQHGGLVVLAGQIFGAGRNAGAHIEPGNRSVNRSREYRKQ